MSVAERARLYHVGYRMAEADMLAGIDPLTADEVDHLAHIEAGRGYRDAVADLGEVVRLAVVRSL